MVYMVTEGTPIHLIVPIITNIVKKLIIKGKGLACLKEAILTPLQNKSGLDLEFLKNYHLISNLSFVSKIIETGIGC